MIERLQTVELKYLPSEKDGMPEDYLFFVQRNEANLESLTSAPDPCFVPT